MVIGVCDDIEIYRKRIVELCQMYFSTYNIVCMEFSSGEEVLNYNQEIDLLILDIEMQGVDGIEVKNKLVEQRKDTAIIFMTSHSERMIESFGKNVYGFIDKNDNKQRLFELLDMVLKDIMNYCLIEIEEDGIKKNIRSDSIIRLEVFNQYVYMYTESNKYIKRISMKDLEDLLVDYDFYRINRKHMINFRCVVSIKNNIKLINNYEYRVSQKIYLKFREAYFEFIKRKAR